MIFYTSLACFFFFFLQEEDGIRDSSVTGVQTCALPISLDAWSTAAALAAVTERLEIMIAVRPTFHPPALLAKQAATLDHLSGGRISLNVVSSWWEDEARQYGVPFDSHDARYARTAEWLAVVRGMWSEARFSYRGRFYD